MAFVPGLQGAAAVVALTAVSFKGAALLGTLLAHKYGNANLSQVIGRGLDFGTSLIPGVKGAKLLAGGKKQITLAGEVKRAIWYDNPKRATGYLRSVPGAGEVKGAELKWVTRAGKKIDAVTPKNYFRTKTAITGAVRMYEGGTGLYKGGHNLVKDISAFNDPVAQDSWQDKAPDAAKAGVGEVLSAIGDANHEKDAAKLAGYVAKPVVKKVAEVIVK
jgi:hypothetical protein